MLSRDDIRGRLAPRWAQSLLNRRYGLGPFGEPRFRLVWAPARLERSGGFWCDFDSGRLLRRRAALRWMRKYPGEEAWLVEAWLPAAAYGSPALWYSPISAGGTLVPTPAGPIAGLGDYPVFGDYEDIGARMYWYPSERHLTLAVDYWLWQRHRRPANSVSALARRLSLAAERQVRSDRDYAAFCAEVLADADQAFHGAPMSGYGGAHRPSSVELCDRLGIRSHPF